MNEEEEETQEESAPPRAEGKAGLSDEEFAQKVHEGIVANLSPALQEVVRQDPSQLQVILQMGGNLVEEQLQAYARGEDPNAGRQQAPPPKPKPREGESEKDFLDRAYEFMQSKAWEDKQAGLSDEEIRRRHWRRDFELRQAVSEKQARDVLEGERQKAFQTQTFFQQNPDFQSPFVAQEVMRRLNEGQSLMQVKRDLQPLVDQQKQFYGVPQGAPPAGQGGRNVAQFPQKGRRPSPSQYDTYAETGGGHDDSGDYAEEARNEFKKMIKEAKPGSEYGDAIWKKIRERAEQR